MMAKRVAGAKRVGAGVVAVMAIDPGVTTGVARGVFDLDAGDGVLDVIASVTHRAAYEVVGREVDQARDLYEMWTDWVISVSGEVDGGGLSDAARVCEYWTPRLPLRSSKEEVMYPVRIAAAMEGMREWDEQRSPLVVGPTVYQLPRQAKGYATDERLKRWGLWERGSAHKRDAWRHVAFYLSGALR